MGNTTSARCLWCVLLASCALAASGCATFGAWAGTNPDVRMVYVGTQADWRYITNQPDADQPKPGPKAAKARAEDQAERPFFLPFVVIDLPLSAIADTLMFPLALIADAQLPEKRAPPRRATP